MKSFDEHEEAFVQEAVDDSLRPELIKSLSRKRTFLFWCAMLMTVCALVVMFAEFYSKTGKPGFGGVEFAFALGVWMQVLKLENDLRLLRLVEKLKALSTR
jgi:hypothetical protein